MTRIGDDYEDEHFELPDDEPAIAEPIEGETGSYLITSGLRAGQIVRDEDLDSDTEVKETAVPTVRSHLEALNSDAPIFMIQCGSKFWLRINEVFAALHRENGRELSFGAVAGIPSTGVASTQQLNRSDLLSVKIADPQGYLGESPNSRLDIDPDGPTDTAVKRAPYLAKFRGQRGYLEDVTEQQRARGANVILTPGFAIDPYDVARSFAQTQQEAEDQAALLEDEELHILNMTLPRAALADESIRDDVLAQLLDLSDYRYLFVRTQWGPRPSNGHVCLMDQALLSGHVELAELMLSEKRTLLLPQTGLTGWMNLAFGACGFSSGANGSDRGFFNHTRGGSQPPPKMLHPLILHRISSEIYRDCGEHSECNCRWGSDALSSLSTAPDRESAALHDFYAIGKLTAAVAAAGTSVGSRRDLVKQLVSDASAEANQLLLVDKDVPTHLPRWAEIL